MSITSKGNSFLVIQTLSWLYLKISLNLSHQQAQSYEIRWVFFNFDKHIFFSQNKDIWMPVANTKKKTPLHWLCNELDGSDHQSRDCLLTFCSGTDQRKHQSSASLAFVWGIHRGPVNSQHKWPVTRKMFPFDYIIMSNDLNMSLYHNADISMVCGMAVWASYI